MEKDTKAWEKAEWVSIRSSAICGWTKKLEKRTDDNIENIK